MRCASIAFFFAAFLAGPSLLAQVEIPPGFVVSEDMILPEEALHAEGSWTGTPWTNNQIPYVFNANVTPANRTSAIQAMNEVDALCSAGFIPRTSQTNYIEFIDANVNRSAVGMVGGRQFVEMFNWTTKYIIVHELFHALGFIHEHQRSDRAGFVTISSANYAAANAVNFDLVSNSTNPTNYDFLSIMHYGGTAFSTNGQNTITCNAGFTQFQNQMGNRLYLTTADAQGLQNRYGAPNVPFVTSVTPSSVSAGSAGRWVTLNCGNVYAGSPTNQGVQGTRVRVNGIELATNFLGINQLEAYLPSSYFTLPGTLPLSLINPAPGGGASVSSVTLSVVCAPGPSTSLPAFTPQTLTNPCTTWSTSPGAAWNVVAVSPQCPPGVNFCANDWDLSVGSTSSAYGSSSCDFLAGHYYGPPPPTFTGNCFRYSGSGDAVMERVTASALTIGQPSIASLPAGSIVRAFQWYGAGAKQVTVSGSSELSWAVLSNNGFWRGRSTAVASGTTLSNTVTTPVLVNDGHVLVVFRDGGASTQTLPFTVQVCNPTSAVALTPGPALSISAACQSFTTSPSAGQWNLVGVSSTSDWDINLGPAVSEFGGSSGDFVVANGHLGSIFPTNGSAARYSGAAGAILQQAFAQTFTAPGGGSGPTYGFGLAQFQVVSAGNYELSCSAPAGYNWSLFAPGTSAAWRPRNSAALTGAADGTVISNVYLAPGWYAVGVAPDTGPPVFLANFSVTVVLSPVQPPVITSLNPSSIEAGIGSRFVTVYGDHFAPNAEVLVSGTPAITAVVSANELLALVDGSLLLQSAQLSIQVTNPGSGLPDSNVAALEVVNPIPVPTSLFPDSIPVGALAQSVSISGSAFVTDSVVLVGGVPVATTYVSTAQLDFTIPAGTFAAPGSVGIEVVNPAPAGGTGGPLTLNLVWPAPDLFASTPSVLTAGSPATPISLYGDRFTTASEARLDGIPLLTTFVSETELLAILPETLILAAGAPNLTVFSPAPGGGESAALGLNLSAPFIASITPASFLPLSPTDPSVALTVSGADFLPTSILYANGEPLPTTYVDGNTLTADLPATVPQTQRLGAIVMNVANSPLAVSASVPILTEFGYNVGTLRRQPLAPAAGDPYAIHFEAGLAFAPLTVIVDAGNPLPIGAWPDATSNFVLAVTDLAGSVGPWIPILDGVGVFGPSTGSAYDIYGAFTIPGLVRPSPALGVDLTAQALFLDPAAPLGFTLTWARFPESL
jgi:hypothetical protein